MFRTRIVVVAVLACSGCSIFAQTTERFRDPSAGEEERISDFLGRLTLDEKIGLFGRTLNVPRLGVHMSGLVASPNGTNGNVEGLHGVALGGPGKWGKKLPGSEANGGENAIATTQFPQAAGLGETWDPELIQRVAAEEGLEARYVFEHQDRGGLIVRAPNADLARDPRWEGQKSRTVKILS